MLIVLYTGNANPIFILTTTFLLKWWRHTVERYKLTFGILPPGCQQEVLDFFNLVRLRWVKNNSAEAVSIQNVKVDRPPVQQKALLGDRWNWGFWGESKLSTWSIIVLARLNTSRAQQAWDDWTSCWQLRRLVASHARLQRHTYGNIWLATAPTG